MSEINATVTDIIGDEYQKWREHDKIFISAPTGTGKTYFILNVLLPYVCQQRKRILYLVNRRILKEQLTSELSRRSFELRSQVTVELYQTIELSISNIKYDFQNSALQAAGYQSLPQKFYSYDYIVCDECHYFLADSNYNTNTGLSYRWIQDFFSSKIRIFLSATIHDIKEYIIADDKKRQYYRTPCYGFHGSNTISNQLVHRGNEWSYGAAPNYDYLDVHIINRKDEISDLVVEKGGKWLIFVDSISFGKNLQTELKAKWGKSDEEGDKNVVMLSSDYESSQDSALEVGYIKKDNRQSAKVLISTSVMDNGISLKDIELRDVILIADTEVEFMQMLGRKRKDGERLNLYIYRLSQEHFVNRLYKIKKIREIAEDYFSDAKRYVEEPLLKILEFRGDISEFEIIDLEMRFINNKHRKIMQDIDRCQIENNDVHSIFNVYNGVLFLNFLSFKQIEILAQYYYRILDAFDSEGEDAFLKEQLRWLKKSDAEIEDIISKCNMSREEKCRQELLVQLEEIKDKKMNKEEAIAFKKKVKYNLLVLAQSVDKNNDERKTVISAFEKADRPISQKNMKFMKEFCSIPYEIENIRNESYIVRYIGE